MRVSIFVKNEVFPAKPVDLEPKIMKKRSLAPSVDGDVPWDIRSMTWNGQPTLTLEKWNLGTHMRASLASLYRYFCPSLSSLNLRRNRKASFNPHKLRISIASSTLLPTPSTRISFSSTSRLSALWLRPRRTVRALPNLEIFCAPDMNNQFRIKNIRNGIFLTSPLQFD